MTALEVLEIEKNYIYWFKKAGTVEDNFYYAANGMVAEVATFFNLKKRVVAGMVAAISPMVRWDWITKNVTKYPNLDNVVAIIHGVRSGHTFDMIKSKVTAFPSNIQKAIDILKTGKVYPIVKGNKTFAFFYNIMRPWSDAFVTIDIWMHRAGLDDLTIGKVQSTKMTKNYEFFRQALVNVAEFYSLQGHQVQAAIWKATREYTEK